MTPLFAKLNLKAQKEILVLGAPPSFEPELAALGGVQVLRDAPRGVKVGFALAFASTLAELDEVSARMVEATEEDAILWVAYPKGTSRRYACEFNRNGEWKRLRESGFQTVRQVAIDEDWSALRFRRVVHIPSRTRK